MANILVVDDEESVRVSLRMVLTAAGHKVTEACNGLVADRKLEANSYDLVVTDIIMPDKEGIELISDIAKLYPDVKVIAITGGGPRRNLAGQKTMGTGDMLSTASMLGADDTLDKPFSPDELIESVDACLSGSRDRKRAAQPQRASNRPLGSERRPKRFGAEGAVVVAPSLLPRQNDN